MAFALNRNRTTTQSLSVLGKRTKWGSMKYILILMGLLILALAVADASEQNQGVKQAVSDNVRALVGPEYFKKLIGVAEHSSVYQQKAVSVLNELGLGTLLAKASPYVDGVKALSEKYLYLGLYSLEDKLTELHKKWGFNLYARTDKIDNSSLIRS